MNLEISFLSGPGINMRNLTQEAIEYAEGIIIQTNPPLANAQIRSQLPDFQKQMIIMQLEMLYDSYMASVIEEIKHPNLSE